MSTKKRLSASKSANSCPKTPKLAATAMDNGDGDEGEGSDDLDNSIINTLPNETILLILSNLSHGDLLWSRLVCKKWNEIVTNDVTFLRSSIIRICEKSENRKNRNNVLTNSTVKWKNLHVKHLKTFGIGRALPVEVPIHIGKEVETLKISYAKLSWKGFQQTLVQFPALIALKISHSEILGSTSLKEKCKATPATSLQSEFEDVVGGITDLIISRCELPNIVLFLSRFQKPMKKLLSFVIREDKSSPFLLRRFVADIFQLLFELIEGNAGTLQYLGLCITENEVIENLLEKLVQKLNNSPIASTTLNLKHICFRCDLIANQQHSLQDLETLVQFLKINKNLKNNFCFPEVCPPDIASKLLSAIPKDIVKMEFPGTSFFSATPSSCVFNGFKKLENIYIHENVRCSRLRLELLEPEAMPDVTSLGTLLLKHLPEVQLVTRAFPNLVLLKLAIIGMESTKILHHIFDELKLLVELDLNFGRQCEITDYTVTRIPPPFCLQLQDLYFGESLSNVPAHILPYVNQNSLCSLQRLEKLAIECEKMHMTNVGLCFGFRFPRLKHLHLSNIGSRTNITTTGLRYIADFNPGLERVFLHRIVSTKGPLHDHMVAEIEDFKRRLDRCKDFRMKISGCEDSYLHFGFNVLLSSSSSLSSLSDTDSDHSDISDISISSNNSDDSSDDSSDSSMLGLNVMHDSDSESDDSDDSHDGLVQFGVPDEII